MYRILTPRQIWKEKKIHWVKSYDTILKYINISYKDIFKPQVRGEGKGKRLYIKEENLNKFVKMFENGEITL